MNIFMSNRWSDNLRKQMDAHQEPAPEGLWEDIELQLRQDESEEPRQKKRVILLWSKRLGAAAAILLSGLLVGDYLLNGDNSWKPKIAWQSGGSPSSLDGLQSSGRVDEKMLAAENAQRGNEVSGKKDIGRVVPSSSKKIFDKKTVEENASMQGNHSSKVGSREVSTVTQKKSPQVGFENGHNPNSYRASRYIAASRNSRGSAKKEIYIARPITSVSNDGLEENGNPASLMAGIESVEDLKKNASSEPAAKRYVVVQGAATTDSSVLSKQDIENYRKFAMEVNQPTVKKSSNSAKWLASVYASQVPSASTKKYDGYGSFAPERLPTQGGEDYPLTGEDPYEKVLSGNRYKEVYTDVKHKQPIVMGISASYRFTKNWSLTGGLMYTILSSNLRSGSDSYYYNSKQTLHNVGIGLNANYNLWNSGRVAIYLSGGGQVEKNISGKLTTDYYVDNEHQSNVEDKISIEQLFWSLNTSVGVQYNLLPRVGLYAEPGVCLYFKNGSDIETIYKQKPVNLNLKVGFRFSLGESLRSVN